MGCVVKKIVFFKKIFLSNFRSSVGWVLSDFCVASNIGSNTIVASEYAGATPMLLPTLEARPVSLRSDRCLTQCHRNDGSRTMWHSHHVSSFGATDVELSATEATDPGLCGTEFHIGRSEVRHGVASNIGSSIGVVLSYSEATMVLLPLLEATQQSLRTQCTALRKLLKEYLF